MKSEGMNGSLAWIRAAERTAAAAALFSLVVFVLLLGNMIRSRAVDPVKPVILEKRLLEVNRDRGNERLKAKVRQLDREVRSAWFNGRAFAVKGFYLLIGGVVVFLIATEVSQALRRSVPVPRPSAMRDAWTAAAISRRSVAAVGTVGGGVLVLIAVVSRHDAAAEYARAADREFRQLLTQPNPAAKGGLTTEHTANTVGDRRDRNASSLPVQPIQEAYSGNARPMPVAVSPAIPTLAGPPPSSRAMPSMPSVVNSPPSVKRALVGPARPEGWGSSWPVFRGPEAAVNSIAVEIPAEVDAAKGHGIVWKADVPLPGWNSPVVWGDRVFVTGANKTDRAVYCYTASTGALEWKLAVPWPRSDPGVKVMDGTGYAPSTGAVDGKRFFATFVNGDVVCVDLGGKLVWTRNLGVPENGYGHAASLALYGSGVIVQFDQGEAKAGKSRVMALDVENGSTVWETARPVGSTWSTPVVARIGEKDLLVTCADPWVIAYEPVSGKELWRADCLRGEIVASPAVGNGYVLVSNQGSALSAINPGGSGDVTKSAIAWKYEEDLPDIASPAADGDLVYLATSEGLVVCIDSKTGKKVWDHEYQASFHASPTVVGNRLVLLDSKGAMFVLETGRQFREISQGKFEEDIEATPAFAPGRMFVRGAKRLYCVGGK